GLARIEDAGIEVTHGVCEAEAQGLNRGFFLTILEKRPLVALKLAMTLDGRIASRTGSSRWITGAAARRHGHLLRARHDAILVGRGTVVADDPDLRCRLPGLEDRSPVRVVLSRGAPIPEGARILEHLDLAPVLVMTPESVAGGEPQEDGWLHPRAVLEALALRGVTRLLVEGGATTAAQFLRAGLVDRLYLYRAPALIGGDGLAAVAPLGVVDVACDMLRFRQVATRALGSDRLEVYEPAGNA
ncbi:MAG: bifunctional diaminohydroxyphosphoribosylaminopyrimidine deaminase/5-amino-6-(5-phosphoribosylamino)uracil reductase RibD, partial [Alphaproteobacteria bacterium]